MSRDLTLVALVFVVAFAACAPSSPAEPILTEGQQVGPGALSTPELVSVAALRTSDQLFQLPVDEVSHVYVRVRDGAAPLMFATSCGLLSSFDLPDGWEGRCLERVVDGRLETGVFLYSAIE